MSTPNPTPPPVYKIALTQEQIETLTQAQQVLESLAAPERSAQVVGMTHQGLTLLLSLAEVSTDVASG